jgi:hypothetical protein
MFQPQIPNRSLHSYQQAQGARKRRWLGGNQPYSDVKYFTAQEIGATGKRSLLNVGHVNARERGKSKRGKLSIPEAKSCVIVGKRDASSHYYEGLEERRLKKRIEFICALDAMTERNQRDRGS